MVEHCPLRVQARWGLGWLLETRLPLQQQPHGPERILCSEAPSIPSPWDKHHGGAAHTQPQHCWTPSPRELPPNTIRAKPPKPCHGSLGMVACPHGQPPPFCGQSQPMGRCSRHIPAAPSIPHPAPRGVGSIQTQQNHPLLPTSCPARQAGGRKARSPAAGGAADNMHLNHLYLYFLLRWLRDGLFSCMRN